MAQNATRLGRGHDFFIVYASEDVSFAQDLFRLLSPHWEVFLDKACIPIGVDWDHALQDALVASSIVVVLVSKNTNQAYFARYEIQKALTLANAEPTHRRVVPVMLDPESDSSEIYGLDLKQRIPSSIGHLPQEVALQLGKVARVALPDFVPRKGVEGTSRRSPKEVHADASVASPSAERRAALLREWEAAHVQREELAMQGDDIGDIDKKIIDLRRVLREHGLQQDDILQHRYRLRRQLGMGGFATVWEAWDRTEGQMVAVKILHGQYANDQSRRDRFFRGARKMAELRHANVIQVLNPLAQDTNYYFFVMALAQEGDFEKAVFEGRLSKDVISDIIEKVADALQDAHSRGMVHRDVTPSNILLGAGGVPLLSDFDLVYAPDTTGGTRTSALGKVVFTAPEILEDPNQIDARSDVFSLGMTALFGYSGKRPAFDTAFNPKPAIDALECSAAIGHVLTRALAYRRDDRFASMSEFRTAFITARSVKKGAPGKLSLWRKPRSEGSLLIVDDEKLIRDVLADFLSLEGYSVRTAADGASALAELSSTNFDVAIVDARMPKMDGIELLRRIRSLGWGTSVVIMTGFGTAEQAVRAMKLGAVDYLLKPFKVEEIVRTVEEVLEMRKKAKSGQT